MLKALIRSRFEALFSSVFRSKNKRSTLGRTGAGSKDNAKTIGLCLLFVYVFYTLIRMFYITFEIMCAPIMETENGWMYFAFGGVMVFGIGVIMILFMTQKQLFDAKDNELLLSMPIKPVYILISRMIMLWAQAFVFEALILLPLGLVYAKNYHVTAAWVIAYCAAALLFPVLTITVTCPVGFILQLLSTHTRRKALFSTVFSIVFLVVYMYFIMRLNTVVLGVAENSGAYAPIFKKAAYPLYFFGKAFSSGSGKDYLIFLALVILPFMVVLYILHRTFIRLTTLRKAGVRVRYKKRSLSMNSVPQALIKKELMHFSSSSMYMVNAGFGLIVLVALPIVMIFKRELITGFTSQFPQIPVWLLMAALLSLISAMNIISAPSVSLEGKNLWIIRSLPVEEKKVLLSKAYAHIVVCIPPVLFASTVLSILLRPGLVPVLWLFLLPLLAVGLTAFTGVVMNLTFPRFDWVNETAAVKQSLSTVFSMLVSAVAIIVPWLIYLILLTDAVAPELFAAIDAVFMVVYNFLCYRYLCTKGAYKFSGFSY